jgi:hypothetical protein
MIRLSRGSAVAVLLALAFVPCVFAVGLDGTPSARLSPYSVSLLPSCGYQIIGYIMEYRLDP